VTKFLHLASDYSGDDTPSVLAEYACTSEDDTYQISGTR